MTVPALTGTRSGTSPASPVSFTTICRAAGYRESLHGRRQDGTGVSIARTPGGLIARNARFSTLIEMAFQTKLLDLAAVPDSFGSERFDIVAKASEKLSGDQYWEMLRALLEDPSGSDFCGVQARPGWMNGQRVSMARIARELSPFAGRPVQDQTALEGAFDFQLQSTPDQRQGRPFSPQSRNSSG
jgi:hypothetical protein